MRLESKYLDITYPVLKSNLFIKSVIQVIKNKKCTLFLFSIIKHS